MHKIVVKVLSNKLKSILPNVIALSKIAFVIERLTTNNIFIAYKTLHSTSTKIRGKICFMAPKLDIKKIYDKAVWSFLEAIMSRMCFDPKWISLIMTCVTTVSYSIIVNGEP